MPRIEDSPISLWSQRSSNPLYSFDTPESSPIPIEVNSRTAENAIVISRRSERKSKNQIAMKSIKTTGSDRSARRAQRSVSRSTSDNHFEMQHEHMLSRQQFRTNTSRGNGNSGPKTSVVVVSGGGNPRSGNSLHGTESYESGYSMLSRRSEQVVPPRTIQSKADQDKKGIIQNVKTIISGEFG